MIRQNSVTKNMRIVAISDTHGYLPKNLPEGDILCICGDIVPLDYQSDLCKSVAWFTLEFVPWVDSLPYKKVIFIGGNHDFFLEALHKIPKKRVDSGEVLSTFISTPRRVLEKLLPGNNKGKHSKLVYLCDNSVEIEGKRFYGVPYVTSLPRWAFNRDADFLKSEIYSNIPRKVDVLLTHMPPRCLCMGEVQQKNAFNYMENYGSVELADAIAKRDIKYVICGHVHSGCHDFQTKGETTYVNVSLRDENYNIGYPATVFDLE